MKDDKKERDNISWILSRVLSPHHPDVLALREAKQVALRSARVPFGATRLLARHQANDEGNAVQVRILAGEQSLRCCERFKALLNSKKGVQSNTRNDLSQIKWGSTLE